MTTRRLTAFATVPYVEDRIDKSIGALSKLLDEKLGRLDDTMAEAVRQFGKNDEDHETRLRLLEKAESMRLGVAKLAGRVAGWIAGIAGSLVTSLIIWMLTHK